MALTWESLPSIIITRPTVPSHRCAYLIVIFLFTISSLCWVTLVVAFLATLAVRAAIFFFEISSSPEWVFWSLQAVAVTIIVMVSFYYSDLYAIDQTLSIRELLLRLMGGVGIACVLIAIVSYPIPQFGKTLYASQMALMVLSLCAWRVGFMRVIERARIHARVLVVGRAGDWQVGGGRAS